MGLISKLAGSALKGAFGVTKGVAKKVPGYVSSAAKEGFRDVSDKVKFNDAVAQYMKERDKSKVRYASGLDYLTKMAEGGNAEFSEPRAISRYGRRYVELSDYTVASPQGAAPGSNPPVGQLVMNGILIDLETGKVLRYILPIAKRQS